MPVLVFGCSGFAVVRFMDSTWERVALLALVLCSSAITALTAGRLARELTHRNDRLLALATIVETTGDAIVAARLDRTITAWNAGAEALFGYTAEEMIGESVSRIVPAGDEHTLQHNLEQMLEKDGKHTYEVTRQRKDGSLVEVQITLSPLRDEQGRLVGISSILRDISDRRKLEADRELLLEREREARGDAEYARMLVEEQNRHLVELDRMKDDFVASVSHELRTPLTSISGYLDLLLEEAEDLSDEHQHYLGVVNRNSERLQRLVGDLLFVAQVDAGRISLEMAAVDLAALIADSVEAVRPVAEEKHIQLVEEVEPIELEQADALRLGQVLDNVLSNAVKFTPADGSVCVRASLADGRAVVEVADTGMGIAPEDQARLFDRFFRTAAAHHMAIPGTGLGLAIAKAIVEGHDGSISIASEPGHGTTVRLELPAHAAKLESPRYVETLL